MKDQSRRRTPRLVPFLFAGAVLGLAVAGILALSGNQVAGYSVNAILGYFSAIGILLGGLIGALVYLILDRRASE